MDKDRTLDEESIEAGAELQRMSLQAGSVFTPASPVREEAIFAGRHEVLRQVIDGINQAGQHVMIYGERGVGKTSLANIVATKLHSTSPIIVPRVNCDTADDYSSIWHKAFGRITITNPQQARLGFVPETYKNTVAAVTDKLPAEITPEIVRKTMAALGQGAVLAVVIDEFDRITKPKVKALFADTIKMLADEGMPATVILVGVADTVGDLIAEHLSIQRALVQVQMPRMSHGELEDIVRKGINLLGMAIEAEPLRRIAVLSQGLPHYTHFLALWAAREALDDGSRAVKTPHFDAAVKKALVTGLQTIKTAYHKATVSHRLGSLHAQVLLACALAPLDDMGFFAPADVREPMSIIMGRPFEIPNFARHLGDFCEADRGPVLQRAGVKHRYRYRFLDPLMQPYVAIKGAADGTISPETIDKFTPRKSGFDSQAKLPK